MPEISENDKVELKIPGLVSEVLSDGQVRVDVGETTWTVSEDEILSVYEPDGRDA